MYNLDDGNLIIGPHCYLIINMGLRLVLKRTYPWIVKIPLRLLLRPSITVPVFPGRLVLRPDASRVRCDLQAVWHETLEAGACVVDCFEG